MKSMTRRADRESVGGQVSTRCFAALCILWARYVVLYPLLMLPSLYFPGDITADSFSLDIFMINLVPAIALCGMIAAMWSGRHRRALVLMNAAHFVALIAFVSLTSALT